MNYENINDEVMKNLILMIQNKIQNLFFYNNSKETQHFLNHLLAIKMIEIGSSFIFSFSDLDKEKILESINKIVLLGLDHGNDFKKILEENLKQMNNEIPRNSNE